MGDGTIRRPDEPDMGARTLVVAVVGLFIALGAEAMAAPWSAPRDLGAGQPADLAFARGGRGMLVLVNQTIGRPSFAAATGTPARLGKPYRLTRRRDSAGFGPF